MGADWMREAQHLTALSLRGRAPSVAEVGALAARSAGYSLRAVEAGTTLGRVALAPIHRAATGNAKRLRKARRKKG